MKILIADPHPEVRSALHLLCDRIPEVSQVSEAGNLVQLLAACTQVCPDLILFDSELIHPARSQAESLASLVRVLQHLCPHAQVVVMSSRFGLEQEAQVAGASGFISKTDPPDVVLTGIVRFLKNRS